MPGIGKILSLVLLYEIDQVSRFPEVGNFLSYARLVRCEHESAGKKKGSGGKKIGNAHLKWAFCEAACLMLAQLPEAKEMAAAAGTQTRQEEGPGGAGGQDWAQTISRFMAQASSLRRQAFLEFVKSRNTKTPGEGKRDQSRIQICEFVEVCGPLKPIEEIPMKT